MLSSVIQIVCLLNIVFSGFATCDAYIPTPPVANQTQYGNLFQARDSNNRLTPIFALHLWGDTPTQRGIAHGYLLCTQIIDWLEFYLIQSIFKGSTSNYDQFVKFLQSHLVFPESFTAEIDGIIQGMNDSKQSLVVPSLGRDITRYDIMAMNSYLEVTAQEPGPFLLAPKYDYTMHGACTQFIATHNFTDDRHLLTGRNMDGECDEAKVTVTHLIVFAIDATTSTSRIVSILWPGFVGSLSAINEDGVYVMMNTGNMNSANVIGDLTPISIIARSIINDFSNSNFSSSAIQKYVVDNFASNGSSTKEGTSGGGAILVIACDKPINEESMFILEMDRLHTMIRKPMDSPDLMIPDAIMTSNHFRKYGVNITYDNPISDDEYKIFNLDVRTSYYNSSWRYETGREKLYCYNRTKGYLDVAAMQDLLRSVSHGYSEHSVITQSTGSIQFWIAKANPSSSQWDAPYEKWYHFVFESFFTPQI